VGITGAPVVEPGSVVTTAVVPVVASVVVPVSASATSVVEAEGSPDEPDDAAVVPPPAPPSGQAVRTKAIASHPYRAIGGW
jgi:hypothetical protein